MIENETSLVAQTVKRLSTMRETRVRSLGREDPLEKEMAIHSSTIAWKIPWTEEPGRLQSMGLQRVRQDLATEQQQLMWVDVQSVTQSEVSQKEKNKYCILIHIYRI